MRSKQKTNVLAAFFITAFASLTDPATAGAAPYSANDDTQEGRMWGPHNVFRPNVVFDESPGRGYTEKTKPQIKTPDGDSNVANKVEQKLGKQISDYNGGNADPDGPKHDLTPHAEEHGYDPVKAEMDAAQAKGDKTEMAAIRKRNPGSFVNVND